MKIKSSISVIMLSLLMSSYALSHGDGAPQPVNTDGLEPIGEEWLTVNPYRGENETAIQIGESGYTSNCARCHGLDVRSGGIAPDLRFLPEDPDSDAWYINRVRNGYSQNGFTKMPKFEGLMSQEAMWAIRSYIDAQPE